MTVYRSPLPPVPLRYESIFTYLFRTHYARHPPEAAAYTDAATGRTLSRAQTRELSLAFAYGVRHTFAQSGGVPLARGDVLMVFSPNSIAWPVLVFGGWAAGLRLTLTNSAYTPREVAYQWVDSGAKAVVVQPALLGVVLDAFKSLGIDAAEARKRIIVADWGVTPPPVGLQGYVSMSSLLTQKCLAEEEKFPGDQTHETTLLCYSSGTTGQPKGVEVSHLHCPEGYRLKSDRL